jgi:hypothetical protein
MRALFAVALAGCLLSFAGVLSALEGWERLGTRTVEFRQDSDTITIGRNEGRFSAILLEVSDGTLEMDNIRVIFGNGASFSPRTRLVFQEDSRSRVIDLPGETRIIRSIAFNYRSLHAGQGRATINVYGR